jgi:dihydroorotase
VEALIDGTIDCIVTDHAPHAADEKARGMLDAPFGVVGLETALGVTTEKLVHQGVLGWSDLVKLLSVVPGRILGVEGGTLGRGASADLTLIDLETPWHIDPEQFHSKSRNTPFAGWEVRGRAVATIVGGELAHRSDVYRSRFDGLRVSHA